MLVIKYTDDTATTVDITDRFNLTNGLTVMTSAEETSKASSQVTAEDPDDDFVISGHRGFFVHEDTAPFERIGIFFTNTRTHSRDAVWYTEGSHNVAIDLDDVNTLLSRQILHGNFDRPAETDVQRIAALLATTEMSFIGDPTTYVDTTAGVAMDPVDYTGQSTQNVIQDCMDTSGRNAYCFQTFSSPNYVTAFWYAFASNTDRSSDLRITNYLPDVDADAGAGDPGAGAAYTWFASKDAELQRDPTRVYSGVFANYDGGAVFRENTATALAFAHRHTVVNWPNVKSSAKAIARADRYLATINTEEDVITVTIEVSPAHVNDAREGERIQCRFTHLPGYEFDYSWMRILNRAVTFVTPAVYRIKYTLSAAPTPSISCSTQLATMTPNVQGDDFLTVDYTTPITFAIPAVVGGVAITGIYQRNGYSTIGYSAAISGHTQIESFKGGAPAVPESCFAGCGYRVGGGDMTVAWTPAGADGFTESDRTISVHLTTAATAPVQTGVQEGTGGSIVLGGAPTVGNILILFRMAETAGFTSDPPGFELIEHQESLSSAVSHGTVEMWARCAEAGDSATVAVGDSSFTHWAWLSEWELTA